MSDYQSKYSKIITDEKHQSVNPNMEYHLTVEEYYDLTHHSHNASEIVGGGSGGGGASDADIDALVASIAELKNDVAELKLLIQQNAAADEEEKDESTAAATELKQNIIDLTEAVNNNATSISEMVTAVNNNTNAVTVQGESIDELKIQVNSLNAYVDQDIQYGETAEA